MTQIPLLLEFNTSFKRITEKVIPRWAKDKVKDKKTKDNRQKSNKVKPYKLFSNHCDLIVPFFMFRFSCSTNYTVTQLDLSITKRVKITVNQILSNHCVLIVPFFFSGNRTVTYPDLSMIMSPESNSNLALNIKTRHVSGIQLSTKTFTLISVTIQDRAESIADMAKRKSGPEGTSSRDYDSDVSVGEDAQSTAAKAQKREDDERRRMRREEVRQALSRANSSASLATADLSSSNSISSFAPGVHRNTSGSKRRIALQRQKEPAKPAHTICIDLSDDTVEQLDNEHRGTAPTEDSDASTARNSSEDREEANRILSSPTNTADAKRAVAGNRSHSRYKGAAVGAVARSTQALKQSPIRGERQSRMDKHVRRDDKPQPPSDSDAARPKTHEKSRSTRRDSPPSVFTGAFGHDKRHRSGGLIETSSSMSTTTTRRHLTDRDGKTMGYVEENLTRKSFHRNDEGSELEEVSDSDTEKAPPSTACNNAIAPSANARSNTRTELDRQYRSASLGRPDVPAHFKCSKARYSPRVSLQRLDASTASGTDRDQHGVTAANEPFDRADNYMQTNQLPNLPAPPSVVDSRGQAIGSGKFKEKSNRNNGDASSTKNPQSSRSATVTEPSHKAKTVIALPGPTRSVEILTTPSERRRNPSTDSGMQSRPTSGLGGEQGPHAKHKGPSENALILPDIAEWVIAGDFCWEDRYQQQMDNYASSPKETTDDPICEARYIEIRKSGRVVSLPINIERIEMWKRHAASELELSKTCKDCIFLGKALRKEKKRTEELSAMVKGSDEDDE